MKLTNLSPIKAGWLVAAALILNVAAWAANIDYPGFLKVENFDGIPPGNNTVAGLTTIAKYTNNQPDSITFVPSAHWQRDPSLDDYGSRVTGFLIPTETADYVFFVAADDATSLYLSTDATPANLKLLCADQGWQSTRAWTGVGGISNDGGTTNVVYRRGHNPGASVLETNGFQWVGPFENRSDEFLYSPRTNLLTSAAEAWPTKDVNGNALIHLVANQRYYLQLLFKEGGGGDYTSVAWKKAGDPDPANGDPEIPGSVLLVNWTNTATFITQPVSKQVYDGETVTFSCTVLGVPGDSDMTAYTYDWFLNDVEITDGSGDASTYNIPVTALADNGKKFKVRVTTTGASPAGVLTLTSTNATLSVINDSLPPTITQFRSSDTFNSAKIIFSEAVRNEAVTPANYVFSGGLTVTNAIFDIVVDAGAEDPLNPVNPSNRVAVILFTTPQAEGAQYTFSINNVKDIKGNNLTPNTGKLYANVFRSGVLSYKRWNVGKLGKDALEADPVLYANPALSGTVTLCERNSPSAPEPGYVAVIGGFFIPPVTTNYVFFTSQDADNLAFIYLSTDANPANRKVICSEPGWQNARQWTGAGGDTNKRRGGGTTPVFGEPPFENRSDQLLTSARCTNGVGPLLGLLPANGTDPDPWPVLDSSGNALITLTAGVRYSFQQWQTERDGGQQSATYKYAGPENAITEPEPVNGTASRLTGNVIGAFIDPTSVPPTLSIARSGGVTTLTYLGTLLSSSTANGTYLPVAGATSPYTVPTPTVGNQFYRAAFLYP